MKYLSDYVKEDQSRLFKELGVFFAFSVEQFEKEKVEGVTYVNMGVGMLCPKDNMKALKDGIENIHKRGVAEDIKENGKEKIILRELDNYEAFYTWELNDAIDALDGYGFTRNDVEEVFNKYKNSRGEY